jgi:hypothetical protein
VSAAAPLALIGSERARTRANLATVSVGSRCGATTTLYDAPCSAEGGEKTMTVMTTALLCAGGTTLAAPPEAADA